MEKINIEIINGLKLNQGASENQIVQLQEKLAIKLPSDYLEFLTYANGFEGLIADRCYISIWSIDNNISLNEEYCVEEFAPGLILFGSDGGNTAFAFDTRNEKTKIVSVPFIVMSLDEVKFISFSFNEFLENYCQDTHEQI